MLFADPAVTKSSALYEHLIKQGFRRSGEHIYRPGCRDCQACISLRLPIARFIPRRVQRRVWALNESDIQVVMRPAEFREAHFRLYSRYLQDRHPDGGMAGATPEDFMAFLTSTWCDTRFYEFHLDGRLAAVAVTDLLPQGLSAVYTFFDPDLAPRSLGVYAILWQIHEARHRGLPWLYLGYWVPGCRKMDYKARYRPLQIYRQGEWQEFTHGEVILPRGIS